MNRNSPGLNTAQAIAGFVQAKTAEALSPRTLDTYHRILKNWLAFVGTVEIASLTTQDLRAYLAYLRTDYEPRRLSGDTQPLAPKTIRNVYVTLRSLFTWLEAEFGWPSPMKPIPAPEYAVAEVEPYAQSEVEALLKAAEFTREAQTHLRRRYVTRRTTALRDRAIILVLLDTGLRASEFCALNIGDVELNTGKVTIKHGETGGAKGGKGRIVYLGKVARRALWRYLVSREDVNDHAAPLFLARSRRMRRDTLRQLVESLGEKAQVKHSHPHRFRHTFGRSGGDVFSLQRLLGHSTLDMSRHYARLAQVDIEQAHRKASPADNWRL